MGKPLLVWDSGCVEFGIKSHGDELVFTYSQDVTEVMDHCASVRNSGQAQGTSFGRPIMEIPFGLVEHAREHYGLDILNSAEDLDKFCNHRDFQKFRLWG